MPDPDQPQRQSPAALTQAPMLRAQALSKSYRLGSTPIPVLEGLSLEVHSGELVVIMGPSGSGKTTLLNCVSGIDAPDAGQVMLRGQTINYSSEHERTMLRRHRIGMVFQFFNLMPTLTVHENVALPFLVAGQRSADSIDRVREVLREVGIERRSDHHPFQLSGGEMQLVSIARALVHRPDLLLADEPTGNVNPRVARSIMDILRTTVEREGVAMLMVTHNPEHAAWADRICFLKDGAIAAEHHQGGRRDDVAPIHEKLLALNI